MKKAHFQRNRLYFKKSIHPLPYVSVFIKALLRGLCFTTQFLAVRVQMSHCDDSVVLMTLQYCSIS